MYDAGVALNEYALAQMSAHGEPPGPGNKVQGGPMGSYRTADGYIEIAVFGDRLWQQLCAAIGREDLLADARFATDPLRALNTVELREELERWLGERTTEEAHRRLLDAGVPAAPVADVDAVLRSPQARARGMVVEVDDPAFGPIELAGNPLKVSPGLPTPAAPAPALGEHTRTALADLLGLDDEALERLASSGVIAS
jgi:formyl-CoA transferase